jgi:serine protease Do
MVWSGPSDAAAQDTPEILQRLQDSQGRRSQRELNAIRDRRVGSYERESSAVLRELLPVVSGVRSSTFEVINPSYWVSMGAVVTSDGYAITKASELEQDQPIKARFGRDKTVSATLVKVDTENDVALLKLEEGTYQPIHLHAAEPQPGQILLSVGVRDPIMALGVCSCEARSLQQRNRGQIGVVPQETPDGIAIFQVQNAAYRAGLRDGDVIVSIQGREVRKVPEFVSLIRKYRAGDELTVTTKRGDSVMDFTVKLGNLRAMSMDTPRFEAMNMLGSINSQRSGSFPWAMQHDSPLLPEQCGGPLVNLAGEVVGVNIARGGRTASYALTGEHLAEVLRNLEIPGWPAPAGK